MKEEFKQKLINYLTEHFRFSDVLIDAIAKNNSWEVLINSARQLGMCKQLIAPTSIGDVSIKFYHVKPICAGDVMSHKCKMLNFGDAGTYCRLERNGETISQGQSVIHESDKFNVNKEIGRKFALKRAVTNLFPGYHHKEDREIIWATYFAR